MSAGAFRDVGRQRPEHVDARPSDRLRGLPAASLGPTAIGIGDEEAGQDAERRVAEESSPKELLVGERVGIEGGRGPDGVMRWGVGLDHNFAGELSPSGAAGDLREELERPLRGAIVGQVERHIGRDDGGERHRRQVEALCRELGSDEDVDSPVAEVVVHRFEAAARPNGVRVQACDAKRRKARE